MQLAEGKVRKIENIVSQAGFVIFDLKLINSYPAKTLKVLIDAPCGGITIKECAVVNRKLSELFEAGESLEEAYSVEVSSPGVDWPLKEAPDFRRVISEKVHIYLKEKQEDKTEIAGILKEIREDSLILEIDNESVEIKLDNINKAKECY